MSGIKSVLQTEVFDSLDERILAFCNVSKLLKKKKSSYLCVVATATNQPRILVTLCEVKQSDKNIYKKKRSWSLDEIKVVDGKSDATDTHEFDLLLEKQYKWFAANLHERQNLITVLWKQINKHVQIEKANFKNIPKVWLMDSSPVRVVDEKFDETIESVDDIDGYEDFHALTEKEEGDLNKLISECNFAISNAELFMEQLGKNLTDLDGANVQSVLASEKQVDALMEQIETAINEAEKVETRLDSYDEILCHIRDTMEKMGEKNAMIEIANKNNIKLLSELDKVVGQLNMPRVYGDALTKTDLTNITGVKAAIVAGKALQNAMNSDIDPSLLRLTAVQDQRKEFDICKGKFSQSISRHLNNLFIHLGNETADHPSSELSLAQHSTVHKELVVYTELMHWAKSMDRKAYDGLTKVYTASLSKVYEKEIRQFFEQARLMINPRADEMNTSISGKSKLQSSKQVSQPYGILGINKELWSHGVEPSERQKFDSILEKVLGELEPVALSEQLFCISFFQLDVLSPTSKNTQTTLDGLEIGDASKDEKDAAIQAMLMPQKKIDRQVNEEVRRMMGELFKELEQELVTFICGLEKLDSL